MSMIESIVEGVTIGRFRAFGYAVGFEQRLAPS
jgi:hypothetical protein